MKAIYRGHEITVTREKCMAGYALLYWSVFRASDGYECASGVEDSSETVAGMMSVLRDRVDAELEESDPWEEHAGT